MISSKLFLAIFASIFILGTVPLVLGQSNGVSSAGLSAGFLLPVEELWQLVIFIALGIYASQLRQSAMILVPLSFILMFVVGMMILMDMQRLDKLPFFLLGAVVLFALSFSIAESRAILFGMAVSASFGFHFGMYYKQLIPDIAAPLHFMIGNILALTLIFSASVSLGLTFLKERRQQF